MIHGNTSTLVARSPITNDITLMATLEDCFHLILSEDVCWTGHDHWPVCSLPPAPNCSKSNTTWAHLSANYLSWLPSCTSTPCSFRLCYDTFLSTRYQFYFPSWNHYNQLIIKNYQCCSCSQHDVTINPLVAWEQSCCHRMSNVSETCWKVASLERHLQSGSCPMFSHILAVVMLMFYSWQCNGHEGTGLGLSGLLTNDWCQGKALSSCLVRHVCQFVHTIPISIHIREAQNLVNWAEAWKSNTSSYGMIDLFCYWHSSVSY